jgi:hypothetical protein
MRQTLRFIIASIVVISASFPLITRAEVVTTQIMLTEKHIEGFILVQKDISEAMETMQGIKSVADYQLKLTASTKKRGFKNVAEYETVAANISMVVAAIDPKTKNSVTHKRRSRKK